jgi:hypothetical protein
MELQRLAAKEKEDIRIVAAENANGESGHPDRGVN